MLIVQKGDLFENYPPGEYFCHAVNCQGVWGIAVEFKEKFPKSFEEYQADCQETRPPANPGEFLVTEEKVICLYTSMNFGTLKDSPEKILKATEKSVKGMLDFLDSLEELALEKIVINSPKINAGEFAVPWEKTEAVLKKVLEDYPNVTWKVWEK